MVNDEFNDAESFNPSQHLTIERKSRRKSTQNTLVSEVSDVEVFVCIVEGSLQAVLSATL